MLFISHFWNFISWNFFYHGTLNFRYCYIPNSYINCQELSDFDTSPTFVCVAESASEGAAHSDVSVLQVLQHQILHWDWLPVNLETVALVPGDGAGQNQQLGEQEHVQFLKENKPKKD